MAIIVLDPAGNAVDVVDYFHEVSKMDTTNRKCHDFTYQNAVKWAGQLTKVKGRLFSVVHASDSRFGFDVVKQPQVGDKAGYYFDGVFVHCGTIERVSNTGQRIATTNGLIFIRNLTTAEWTRAGGNMVLVF